MMKDIIKIKYYDTKTDKVVDYITQKFCPNRQTYITIKTHLN